MSLLAFLKRHTSTGLQRLAIVGGLVGGFFLQPFLWSLFTLHQVKGFYHGKGTSWAYWIRSYWTTYRPGDYLTEGRWYQWILSFIGASLLCWLLIHVIAWVVRGFKNRGTLENGA